MFFIKKSSLFFFKALLLKQYFYKKNILAFYGFLDLISEDLSSFRSLLFFFKLDFFLLSSNFINFFFKSGFFKFLKPGSFLIYFNSFEEFLNFNLKIKELSSFYLVGICFKFFFINFNYISSFNIFFKYNNFINLFSFFYKYIYLFHFG
jgi:hypothetical protein